MRVQLWLLPVYTGIPLLGDIEDHQKPRLSTQCFHPLVLWCLTRCHHIHSGPPLCTDICWFQCNLEKYDVRCVHKHNGPRSASWLLWRWWLLSCWSVLLQLCILLDNFHRCSHCQFQNVVCSLVCSLYEQSIQVGCVSICHSSIPCRT